MQPLKLPSDNYLKKPQAVPGVFLSKCQKVKREENSIMQMLSLEIKRKIPTFSILLFDLNSHSEYPQQHIERWSPVRGHWDAGRRD